MTDDVLIVQAVQVLLEHDYQLEDRRGWIEEHTWRLFRETLATMPERVVLDAPVGSWRLCSTFDARQYVVVAWTIPAADTRLGESAVPGEFSSDRRAGVEG